MGVNYIDTAIEVPDEVILRFAYKKEISAYVARDLFKRMLEFLDNASIRKNYPARDVDDAWHEFILHTHLYAKFCQERYGRFIHHIPISPISAEIDHNEYESAIIKKPNPPEEETGKCKKPSMCETGISPIIESVESFLKNNYINRETISRERCASDCRSSGGGNNDGPSGGDYESGRGNV